MNDHTPRRDRLPRKLGGPEHGKRVLFLGYGREQTKLIDALMAHGCQVWHTPDRVRTTAGFDLAVSFGYRHILKRETIESSPAPIVNLHIAFLPFNRGAHPNFWAFYDGTPSGVTIHLIDEGVDTGPILLQRQVEFGANERTFAQTHARLFEEIESLFCENIDAIIANAIVPTPQTGEGTYHRIADLPAAFSGWDAVIAEEIPALRALESSKSRES
jgi:hypothetical protein